MFLFCPVSQMLLVEWSFSIFFSFLCKLCCMVTKLAPFMCNRHYLDWFICIQLFVSLCQLEEIFTSWWNYIFLFLVGWLAWLIGYSMLILLNMARCCTAVDVNLFRWSDLVLLMQKVQTGVVKNACNPEWNDELTLSISDPNVPILLVCNPFPLTDRVNLTACYVPMLRYACQ